MYGIVFTSMMFGLFFCIHWENCRFIVECGYIVNVIDYLAVFISVCSGYIRFGSSVG